MYGGKSNTKSVDMAMERLAERSIYDKRAWPLSVRTNWKVAVLSWLTPLHVMLYTQARWCVVRSGAQCSGFTNL
jgi:hypothetical protein